MPFLTIDNIAFKKNQMHFGLWRLSREINSLLDLRHSNFSCWIFFCLFQYHNALLKLKCEIVYWQINFVIMNFCFILFPLRVDFLVPCINLEVRHFFKNIIASTKKEMCIQFVKKESLDFLFVSFKAALQGRISNNNW